MPTMPASTRKIHYAWVITAVTFLTLLVTAGIRSTPGVLIVPIEHEFGWSRATISVAISVNLLLSGLMGPFAAAFFDRLGLLGLDRHGPVNSEIDRRSLRQRERGNHVRLDFRQSPDRRRLGGHLCGNCPNLLW